MDFKYYLHSSQFARSELTNKKTRRGPGFFIIEHTEVRSDLDKAGVESNFHVIEI